MASRLTPISLAIFRANGEDRRLPPPSTTRSGAERSIRGPFISIASAYSPVVCLTESFLSVTRRCCGSSETFSPGPAIVANRPPTGTICPSCASTCPIVPSCSASRSRLTLSVSISSTGSPFLTASPAFLYQRMTFPSVIASPILGMMISAIGIHDFLHGRDDLLLVRGCQQFEIAGIGHRHILAGNALDRGVELVEIVLGDAGRDLRGGAERFPLLLHDDTSMGLRHRRVGRLEIQWSNRSQIDHFDFDAFVFRQPLGSGQRNLQHPAVRNDGHIGTFARNACLTKRHGEIGIVGCLPLHAIERGTLEEDHRIAAANGGLQHSFGVGGGRRRDDVHAGKMSVKRFE